MKRWLQRRTLRSRLALWYSLGGALLLAVFSATLYFFVAENMAVPLDRQLRRDLDQIRRRLTVGVNGRVLWDGAEVSPQATWPAENPWFELWDSDNKLVRRLWPFTENRVNILPPAPARGHETISVFDVAEDLRLRVLSTGFAAPDNGPGWMIRVMRVHEPAADALKSLRAIILIAMPVVVALLVVGGYWLTRRWLKPLDQMVAEANRVSANDLNRRLPVINPHDELGRLAIVFNDTLDRLESSFDALDRFVADASHELRTPLTTLQSVGEVGLRGSRSVAEYRDIIGSMLEEAHRLQGLVQRLLELATAEAGAAEPHWKVLRVDEFVASCVGELVVLADSKGQRIDIETSPCQVVTDSMILRQALQNLVDNAVKYSPAGTAIHVSVRDLGAEIEVAVADEGPGIAPEHRVRLAERFFRPDRGRNRESGGFGLGLSITKAYMRVLRGSLAYEPGWPKGGRFRLLLPKAGA